MLGGETVGAERASSRSVRDSATRGSLHRHGKGVAVSHVFAARP